MGRWYYVCRIEDLSEAQERLPVVPGLPRISRDGAWALVRLSANAEGALSRAELDEVLATDPWLDPDEG